MKYLLIGLMLLSCAGPTRRLVLTPDAHTDPVWVCVPGPEKIECVGFKRFLDAATADSAAESKDSLPQRAPGETEL